MLSKLARNIILSKYILLLIFNSLSANNQRLSQNVSKSTANKRNLPIFFTSVPKSGTHLLLKCLKNLTFKQIAQIYNNIENKNIANLKDFILLDHYPYNNNTANLLQTGFKCFCTLRDPRDQIVSLAHWIYKDEILKTLPLAKLNINDLIQYLLEIQEQDKDHLLFTSTIYPYLGWLNNPNFYIVRFENLIGPNGGGTSKKQLTEIYNIAQHLNIKLSKKRLLKIAHDLWGNTTTFREGKIGAWKTHFTEKHVLLAKQNYGQILIDLGYEKNLNWTAIK